MSEEETPDLTKSWVLIDPVNKAATEDNKIDPTSGVEDVVENDVNEPHVDSDTDSISVISESGCSYKTDEDDFVPAASLETEETNENPEVNEDDQLPGTEVKSEFTEIKPLEGGGETDDILIKKSNSSNVDGGIIEKLLYFGTSAICAVILIGFSVAIQHYFSKSSDVNNFDYDRSNDLTSIPHYVQNVKNHDLQVEGHSKKSYKRKIRSKFDETKNQIIKLENSFRNKIEQRSNIQIENNDLTIEDVKSNYKPNKNKKPAVKLNKETREFTNKRAENDKYMKKVKRDNVDNKKKRDREMTREDDDNNYDKKIKELKMKENYLKEKEKYLIEKEHDLRKKERKLSKEQENYGKNRYEKKNCNKKEKKHKRSSEEENPKNNKKYKNKEEKRRNYQIIDDEPHKKRNISGQWFINLHKARNNIRLKEHASDWVFDRAQLRSLKRNKAHWYFQWMVDRARLRAK